MTMPTPTARISDLTVAVLAGGLGTRLRSVVADRPKALAEIHGSPFLAYLLDQLSAAGFRSVVLCTGYLGDRISRAFGRHYGPLQLRYSQEHQPLGTAGALRLAMANLDSDPVLVMNGDSYCGIDLSAYWEWYRQRQAAASLALAWVPRTDRYGLVRLDSEARVVEFAEKKDGGEGWINAGIYFLGQQVLRSIPKDVCASLEREIFPAWVGRGLYGYLSPGPFIDIGTPADFAAAEEFFASVGRLSGTGGGLIHGD
jgi:D-glycero-alpha-D-manno-heptose 1-phosphate guanylyltransferase